MDFFLARIQASVDIYKAKGGSVKDLSDGYHTFDELYFHRMVLSSLIFNMYKDVSWKSKQHHDGTMFGDTNFIVGIATPQGQYSYHYDLEFWDLFDVPEVEFAPEYDGHSPSDIDRLFSLVPPITTRHELPQEPI